MGSRSSKSSVSQAVNNIMETQINNTQACDGSDNARQKQVCSLTFKDCHNIDVSCHQTIYSEFKCIAADTVDSVTKSIQDLASKSTVSDSRILAMPWGDTTRSQIANDATNIQKSLSDNIQSCDTQFTGDQTQTMTLNCDTSSYLVVEAAQDMSANSACKLTIVEKFVQQAAQQLTADSSVKMTGGIIAAIVIVSVLVLVAIIIGLYYGLRNRKGGGSGGSTSVTFAQSAAPSTLPVSTLPAAPAPGGVTMRRNW